MKTAIVCALAFVVLVNGLDGIHGQENRRASIRNANPYKRLLRTRSIDDQQVCAPGETKMDDCNSCHCAAGGWACTRMACETNTIHPLTGRGRRETPYRCEPNSRFQVDCNWCTCTPDGRAAMCTLMGCLPEDWSTPRPLA